jgi:SAM-dependent methyltransferase
MRRDGYSGTGPGSFTPDGCAVDLYRRLPAGSEPEVIEAAAFPGAGILELGCGAGRITHPLVARGFHVTAVDESAEMLARVKGARTVCSAIEALDLGERFDVVLLGSCLVHAPDPAVARGLLASCARHVKPEGIVLIHREGMDWHDNVPRSGALGDGVVRVTRSDEVRPGVRSVHVEYDLPDARWTHTFQSRPLSQAAFEALVQEADMIVDAYLTGDRTWVRCRPRGHP